MGIYQPQIELHITRITQNNGIPQADIPKSSVEVEAFLVKETGLLLSVITLLEDTFRSLDCKILFSDV